MQPNFIYDGAAFRGAARLREQVFQADAEKAVETHSLPFPIDLRVSEVNPADESELVLRTLAAPTATQARAVALNLGDFISKEYSAAQSVSPDTDTAQIYIVHPEDTQTKVNFMVAPSWDRTGISIVRVDYVTVERDAQLPTGVLDAYLAHIQGR